MGGPGRPAQGPDPRLDRPRAPGHPERRVTGLIGFGGEGKSSLARRWVDELLSGQPPAGVFWWAFYNKPNVDEFFEAALDYMSGGRIDPRQIRSASMRAHLIAGMLGAGRYLFVLDGLEVMQHPEGDQYGLLTSADLRDFLGYIAGSDHDSFCLVTSRAPLLDLLAYPSYIHRDVTRLSPDDGRALLREVGVQGSDAALDAVVTAWDGHALTLSLLASHLTKEHGGDIARLDDIPEPTADENRYERVHRVLRRYDEHLTDPEREFLTLFSAFRTPVESEAFERVFRTDPEEDTPSPAPSPHSTLASLDDAAFTALLDRLLTYRLLRYDSGADQYTTHPLIRNHYFARLTGGDRTAAQEAHTRIKDYYLDLAGETPRFPSLDDLAPLIEVVYHACRAGAYDEAEDIRWERISQRDRYVLQHQLGAFETSLALMREFFPNSDTTQEPQVSKSGDKSWILNMVGVCLMSLGRLREAAPFYERANQIKLNITKDWPNASIGYRNLAELHTHLGDLAASAEAAAEALTLARRAEDKQDECNSLCRQATTTHLRGEMEAAGADFRRAEVLEQEINSDIQYLYSLPGIQHAEHLRRAGDPAYARRVTEANLEHCERYRYAFLVSMCHRVLGDLDALRQGPSTGSGHSSGQAGEHTSARQHYDEALKIARGISRRDVLIEALLGRGRWAARFAAKDLTGTLRENLSGLAFGDLNEALDYAVAGGYRIYEADIRVGLAWAHLAAGDGSAARREAQRAQQMSRAMGYHWGQVDAAAVLTAISASEA